MNLRIGLTLAALVTLVSTWLIPEGAIPVWFRLALVVAGIVLLILSYIPKADG